MADELVVSERATGGVFKNGVAMPVLGLRLATQYLDENGDTSNAFSAGTTIIRIHNKGSNGIFYAIGASDVTATANTAGSEYIAPGDSVDEPVEAGQFIATAT